MDKLKISVITTVLNAESSIERTIRSVIDQTYPEVEFLIIDGGSTDKTLDIIKSYQKAINYWISEKDDGLYHAMNKGIRQSSGDYLYFLNADDWIFDIYVLDRVNAYLYKYQPDVLFGRTCLVYPDYKLEISRSFTHKNLRKGVIPPHQGFFIKKTTLDQIGLFDTSFSIVADLDLMCRLICIRIDSQETNELIAYVSSGGASSEKRVSYQEVFEVITKYYGKFWASLYYFNKILLEQGIKRILLKLRFEGLYLLLAKYINKLKT